MTAALVQTTAGATIGISATLPATNDAAGYAALTFSLIGEVTDLGEFGREYATVTHNPIASRRTIKRKGSFNDFLSCLCGSELCTQGKIEFIKFLSCLCGSEPSNVLTQKARKFLSCLCGSEPRPTQRGNIIIFLSCLCGSEPNTAILVPKPIFLSCLCGSERQGIAII